MLCGPFFQNSSGHNPQNQYQTSFCGAEPCYKMLWEENQVSTNNNRNDYESILPLYDWGKGLICGITPCSTISGRSIHN